MWYRIANIWRKELMDSVRDRKGMMQAILIPLLIGVCYAVFNPLINASLTERARQPVRMPAQGIEYAGQSFLDALKKFDITLEPFDGDLQASITRGEQNAGLIIPSGFGDSVANEIPTSLTLLVNPTAGGLFGNRFSVERIDLALNAVNQQVSVARVQTRNVNPELLNPITLQSRDLSTPEQRAGVFASFSLPIMVALIVAQGGLYIAIDVTAGEKERGTLESLLVTPAGDLEVLIGKLAAVFTLSCVLLILTMLGFWAASAVLPASATGGGTLPFSVILLSIIVGLPLALFLSVILMIVSVRTKAFKDAQSAATPIIFAVMVPSMAAAFVPAANSLAFLIPVYGPSAVVSVIATGGVIPQNAVLLSMVGSLAAALVGFVVAMRLFNRERMLYGT